MQTDSKKLDKASDHKFSKWIKRLLICLVLFFFCLFLTVFFLPQIISSTWFKNQVQNLGSSYFNQNLKVKDIHWRWSEGLTISGLSLSDHPEFSSTDILRLSQVHLDIQPLELLSKRSLGLTLLIQGADLCLIKNKHGQLNLDKLLPRAGHKEKTPDLEPANWQELSLAIPVDLRAKLDLKQFNLSLQDKATNQTLALNNAGLDLDMPSLLNSPINIKMQALPSQNQKKIAPVKLALKIQDLASAQVLEQGRVLEPARASVNLNATLPGLAAFLKGSMADKGLQANVQLNLLELNRTIKPFVSPSLPATQGKVNIQAKIKTPEPNLQNIQGNVNILSKDLSISSLAGLAPKCPDLGLNLDFEVQSMNNIAYQLGFKLPELSISGPEPKEQIIGPLALDFRQRGSLNLTKQLLAIDSGKLKFQDKSQIVWQGTVSGLQAKKLKADLNIGPLYLDLQEILTKTRPLLSPYLKDIKFSQTDNAQFALKIEQIKLNTDPVQKSQNISLHDLVLSIPVLQASEDKNKLDLQNMLVQLDFLRIIADSFFPEKAELKAGMSLDSLSWSGQGQISLKALELPEFNCSASDLRPSNTNPIGLTGLLKLKQSLNLDKIKSAFVQTSGLSQDLDLDISLKPDSTISFTLNKLGLKLPDLRLNQDIKDISLPDLTLSSGLTTRVNYDLKSKKADCPNLSADLNIKDLLQGSLQASLKDSGQEDLFLKSSGTLNLSNLFPGIAAYLPRPLSISGKADWDFSLQGYLPADQQINKLLDKESTLQSKINQTGFLQSMHISLKPENLSLSWQPEHGPQVGLEQISSTSPFKLKLNNGLQDINSSLSLNIKKLTSPLLQPLLNQTLNPELSYDLNLTDFNTLKLSETINFPALGLVQNAELTCTELKNLLNSVKPIADALSKTEARGKATLQIDLSENLIPRIKGTGRLNTGLIFQLKPGDRLSSNIFLKSLGLDIDLNKKINILGLKADLSLQKDYQIKTSPEQSAQSRPTLSQRVLNPQVSQLLDQDISSSGPNRTLSFAPNLALLDPGLQLEQAKVQSGSLNLQLANLALNLDQQNLLPCIRNFSCDLLNGSILGSFCLFPGQKQNSARISCSFSGLQANGLVPKVLRQLPGQETEISGRFSAQIPLSSHPEQILEDLQLSLDLTHIGSKTLQQLLFALDPYENNENIIRQRKLLEHGSPRWIKIKIRNGNLSFHGQVQVKGIAVQLPGLERVQLADLGLEQHLLPLANILPEVHDLLEILKAETIYLGSDPFRLK